jgi:hypothetical protein
MTNGWQTNHPRMGQHTAVKESVNPTRSDPAILTFFKRYQKKFKSKTRDLFSGLMPAPVKSGEDGGE